MAATPSISAPNIQRSTAARRRADKARQKRAEARAAKLVPATIKIPCLKCRQPFPSLDKRTNRICEPCAIENGRTVEGPEINTIGRAQWSCGGGRRTGLRSTDTDQNTGSRF